MADSQDEYVVIEFKRGESDVVRLTRRRYEGKPFCDWRTFFRGQDGEMHPTKKGCSIRDSELPELIEALQKIARKIGATPVKATDAGTGNGGHRQRELPNTRRQPQDNQPPLTDEERRELQEAF